MHCRHCDLPCADGAEFCCYGCELIHGLAEGARAEGGSARANVAICAFFAMNLMAVTMILYADDVYGGAGGAGGVAMAELRSLFRWAAALFATPILVILGFPMLEHAKTFRSDPGAGLDALVSIAAFSAFGLSCWSLATGGERTYFEVAAMTLIFVAAGRSVEALARASATEAVGNAIKPELAHCERIDSDGGRELVAAGEIVAGDRLSVAVGAAIPVDGVVVEGEALVDRSALTGEPAAIGVETGGNLRAGDIVVDRPFVFEATADAASSSSAVLERLTREAFEERSPAEEFGRRAAVVLVPLMIAIAVAAFAAWSVAGDPARGMLAAMAVLVCACPCALGIATPLAVRAALARASSVGVLVRSGSALERLAAIGVVAIDKTGTLTDRDLEVSRASFPEGRGAEILGYAAAVESRVSHPIADVVTRYAADAGVTVPTAEDVHAVAGFGVRGKVAGHEVRVGGPRLARDTGHDNAAPEGAAADLFVVVDGRVVAEIELEESLRDDAPQAIGALRERGLDVCILSGDAAGRARRIADALGVTCRAELLPAEKLDAVAAMQRDQGPVLMVGDGTNDAPALAGASLGAAVSRSTDLARAVAEVSIFSDDLTALPWAVDLARSTVRVIRQNFAWTLAYNAVCVSAAASGYLPPVLAAVAMGLSSLTVTLNSARLLRHESHVPAFGRLRARNEARDVGDVGLVFPEASRVIAFETVGAFAMLGLASVPHCALMCGPLAASGCRRDGRSEAGLTAGYAVGRATSYFFLGTVSSSVGVLLLGSIGRTVTVVLCEVIAALLVIEAVARIFPAWSPYRRIGLAGIGARLAPWFPTKGLALGMATGCLPCAALLAAILLAASATHPLVGGVGMLVFAVASLPGLVAPLLAGDWIGRRFARPGRTIAATRLAGAALLVLAVWIGARPFVHAAPSSDGTSACVLGHSHDRAGSVPVGAGDAGQAGHALHATGIQ